MRLTDWIDTVRLEAATRAMSQGCTPSTSWTYGGLKKHLARYDAGRRTGPVRLREIDKRYCEGFAAYLTAADNLRVKGTGRGRKLAPSTRKKLFRLFDTLLNKAVRSGLLRENPCRRMVPARLGAGSLPEKAYLTLDEVRLLSGVPCRKECVRQAFLFSCFCGLRWSDVKSLDWSDIRKEGNSCRIAKKMVKTGEWVFLPLNESALRLLPVRKSSGPVFDLPTPSCANAVIRQWVRAAGIDKKITFHCARHTFATILLTKGADLYTTSQLLGHRSLATTQVYARIVDEKKVRAVRLLDGLME